MNQSPVLGYQPLSAVSHYNSQYAIIKSILSGLHTAVPAQVIKVSHSGDLAPVGYVDLQPLVNQVSGSGVAVPQGIIYNVPYFRLQGGKNAIILDPEVGDIGDALFCERDISSVIATKARANPGSGRQYDLSDGLFICGFLNAVPTQYIQFNQTGLTIFSPKDITIQAGAHVNIVSTSSATVTAPIISLIGAVAVSGDFSVTGSMRNQNVDVGRDHTHPVTQVQMGAASVETGPPAS